jgi:hypothetical protein
VDVGVTKRVATIRYSGDAGADDQRALAER